MKQPESIEDICALVREHQMRGEWWRDLGDVKGIVSPCGTLLKLAYTGAAMLAGRWNFFELNSRGHIYRLSDGKIIARPFAKFFNWGEGGRTSKARLTHATNKLDGSLGIIHRDADGKPVMTTRGSFTSPQAVEGQRLLDSIDEVDMYRFPGAKFTVCVEIIYPENRIIVDYEGVSAINIIGIVKISTGELAAWRACDAVGRLAGLGCVERVLSSDLGERPDAWIEKGLHPLAPEGCPILPTTVEQLQGLVDAFQGDHEGLVLHFDDGQMFKIKAKRYKAKHRAKDQLTEQRVIETFFAGGHEGLIDLLHGDDKHQAQVWLAGVLNKLSTETDAMMDEFTRFVKGDASGTLREREKSAALDIQKCSKRFHACLFASMRQKADAECQRAFISGVFGKKAANAYDGRDL